MMMPVQVIQQKTKKRDDLGKTRMGKKVFQVFEHGSLSAIGILRKEIMRTGTASIPFG